MCYAITEVISMKYFVIHSGRDIKSVTSLIEKWSGINDNIHQVRGHYRSTPSGGVTYVDPHIRTNPNAIVSDNISHNR